MEQTFRHGGDAARVELLEGVVRGFELDGISIFKGIPYGKAKRFHQPEKADPWSGEYDATSYGYVCPLLRVDRPRGELLVPHRMWPMDEDCLNLNIWTPGLDDKKRPVLFWIHGGGYFGGSSIEQVAYDGQAMAKYGDVVVVSVNHRLNVLGYLDVSSFGPEYKNSANAGNADLVLALTWVRDHIEAFGGDPGNVTLFGQSGGGMKITNLLQTPAADGLYHKVLNMSGIFPREVSGDSKGSQRELVLAMMKRLKIRKIRDLETVPYASLAAAYNALSPLAARMGHGIGGTPEKNDWYLGDPMENGFRKETIGIPMIVTSVFAEFSGFMPFDNALRTAPEKEQKEAVEKAIGKENAEKLLPLFQEAYPGRPLADVLTLDYTVRQPLLSYAAERAAQGGKVWTALFNLDQPVDGGKAPWHCADIPYVFHNTHLVPSTQMPGVTEKVEEEIFGALMNFARHGDPNGGDLPRWDPAESTKDNTMVFGKKPEVRDSFDRELLPMARTAVAPYAARLAEGMQIQH